jgi:catechol 2,3-dioxygenase-like lactoylglutathione lyase family enzyme
VETDGERAMNAITRGAFHHLAWRANSRDDVDAVHRLLVDHGVTILDPPAHYPEYWGDYYAVFFEDPDGMKLEVVHAPGWI